MTRLAAQYPPYRLNALTLQVGAGLQNLSQPSLSFPCRCAETILWIAGGWSFPACSRRRAGCAVAIEQRNRGLLPYRPMRAFFVVVPTPILHFFPGVRKA